MRKENRKTCEMTALKCIWDHNNIASFDEIKKELNEEYGLNFNDEELKDYLDGLINQGIVTIKMSNKYKALLSLEQFRDLCLKRNAQIMGELKGSKFYGCYF
ncbi:MAG: hypothetical protein IJ224_09455 [Lachnospiraceae bacterium]|nr:hypothetical protein [Lachnospiraceae bacterium]